MVEPGTAAIAVLSTIAGISGYGAMKINSKQGEMIEAEIQKRIGDIKDLLKTTEVQKKAAEASRDREKAEVERLNAELTMIKQAKQTLEKEKASLSTSLQSVTEGEQLYKSISLPAFKQAVKDFRTTPDVVNAQSGLSPAGQADVNKVFDKLESLSGLSFSRGSLETVYQNLTKASGNKDGLMPRAPFMTLFTEALKSADANLAAAKRREAEEADAKQRADAEAKAAAKQKELEEAAAKDPDLAEKLRKKKEADEAEQERKGARDTAMTEETKLNAQLADPELKDTISNAEKAIAAAKRVVAKYTNAAKVKKDLDFLNNVSDKEPFEKLLNKRGDLIISIKKQIEALEKRVADTKKKIADAKQKVRSKVKSVSTLKERLFKGGEIDKSFLKPFGLHSMSDLNTETQSLNDAVKAVIAVENDFQTRVSKAKKQGPTAGPPPEEEDAIAKSNALMNPPPFKSDKEFLIWFRTKWVPADQSERILMAAQRLRAIEYLDKVRDEKKRQAMGDAEQQKGGDDSAELEAAYRELKNWKGSSRKSTLKKRREGKQNGRGTRRGKNRADRTHSNTR